MKKLIAGNWKMNGGSRDCAVLIASITETLAATPDLLDKCDFLVAPAFIHIGIVRALAHGGGDLVIVAGQDCSEYEDGAYTGDISASMIADSGCSHVILGHSERRQYHRESDEQISKKAERAKDRGLHIILCVGETLEQRKAGEQEAVVAEQLKLFLGGGFDHSNLTIAYEPVWAIGTGESASVDDIRTMHEFIRKKLEENLAHPEQVRILYGGSVKPDNAAEIFGIENVDGALIGGASLKSDDFIAIAAAV